MKYYTTKDERNFSNWMKKRIDNILDEVAVKKDKVDNEKIKEKIGDVEIDITPMSFEDARNYQVSSEKLEGESKFKAEIGLEQGIDEIYELILNNRIKDINDPRYSNQNFLKEHGVS